MFCPTCGFENLDESTFCTQCHLKFHKLVNQNKSEPHDTPYSTLHSPQLALFLSCLLPGGGHAYLGNFKKAIILFSLILTVLLLALYFFGTVAHFLFFMLFSVIFVYTISDSYLSTLKERTENISLENVRRIQRKVGIGFGIISFIIIFFISILFNRYYSTYTLRFNVPILNLKRADSILAINGYYVDHLPKIDDAIIYSDVNIVQDPFGIHPRAILDGRPAIRQGLGKIIEVNSSGINVNFVFERGNDPSRLIMFTLSGLLNAGGVEYFKYSDDAETLDKIFISKKYLKSVKKIHLIYAPLNRRRFF